MHSIRPAAVNGQFYPADPDELTREVNAMLAGACPHTFTPKALIAPHAGYIYSGVVAASAYATLRPIAKRIHRVVLLGPTHRVAVRGLALSGADAFATPLGNVMLDNDAAQLIAHLPQVSINAHAHKLEHALEVQLPFLQSVLPDFKLLPLAVGVASAEEVAEVLELLWGGDETLIVISSDLSHYLPYELAKRTDNASTHSILELEPELSHEQACGATPINGLILAARHHHLTPHLLDLRNSGDTAGPRDGVVGYASFAFCEDAKSGLEQEPASTKGATLVDGRVLLKLGRSAIAECFEIPAIIVPTAEWLQAPAATFVTLTLQGELRGCIGSLEAYRPLLQDVRQNAMAAAFHDPRFSPLCAAELDAIRLEVSMLSPAQPMTFRDEADALAQLQPDADGVIFQYGPYRSTFLPQVWEQLPQPREFMAHLKYKAGLSADFWSPDVKLSRYSVTKWQE